MPEYCSCGAQLVEDARFCHKCGRDLREQPAETPAEPPPLPSAPPPSVPAPIGFTNTLALWIALRVALAAFVLSLITGSFLPLLAFFWFIAAGLVSVYLYRLRSGEKLSATAGTRLGWLTGIFLFVLGLLSFTMQQVAMTMQPELAAKLLEELRAANPSVDPQILQMVRSPAGIFSMLVFLFVLLTALPALGGWIGARFFQGAGSPTDQRNA